MITRLPSRYPGRSPAVVHNGMVYAVATDTTQSNTIQDQTRQTLATIEDLLLKAGSNKSGLIQATVYLRDMANKPAMDAVWCDWIGRPENWPQRACVGVELEDRYFI